MKSLIRFSRSVMIAAVVMSLWVAAVPTARAADNTGTGDIAGVLGDLTNSNTFQLDTTTLALVKAAYANGTALTSGDNIPRGTVVKFMIYVDNATPVPVTDISIQDVLAASFAYTAGTIKVDNTLVSSVVCPLGVCDEDAIFAQVDGSGTLLGDGDAVNPTIDADVASYTSGTSTIDLGNSANANNAQLDIAASNVFAVVFTVTMQ